MPYEHLDQGSLVRGTSSDGEPLVMCQICFNMRPHDELAPAEMDGGYPSKWWDICLIPEIAGADYPTCTTLAGLILGEDGVWFSWP